MIFVLDVNYNRNGSAKVGIIGFNNWEDSGASYQNVHFIESVKPYKAGEFYKRELPCLLEALKDLKNIEMVIVDGYVWLEKPTKYGLGMYLYDALNREIPIIGVAKNRFGETPSKCELFRGESRKALYITSVGIDLEKAKKFIKKMYGNYRLPSLIKDVDTLCRDKKS
jgi:deoxyribonuclease V